MFCPKCGLNNYAESVFCQNCGESLAEYSDVNNTANQPQYNQPQYSQPQYNQPQYSQPQYSQPQYNQPQYNQPQYSQPINNGYIANSSVLSAEYPMKWYKFLIYFSLFASAVGNLISGIQYLTGAQYGSGKESVYLFLSSLKVWDILYGICCIGLAVFAVFVRFQLAKFKKNAPKFLILMFVITVITSLVYSVAALIIVNNSILSYGMDDFNAKFIGNIVGQLIGNAILIIGNSIYFNKRASLFVN